jgi:hypothetical protein
MFKVSLFIVLIYQIHYHTVAIHHTIYQFLIVSIYPIFIFHQKCGVFLLWEMDKVCCIYVLWETDKLFEVFVLWEVDTLFEVVTLWEMSIFYDMLVQWEKDKWFNILVPRWMYTVFPFLIVNISHTLSISHNTDLEHTIIHIRSTL